MAEAEVTEVINVIDSKLRKLWEANQIQGYVDEEGVGMFAKMCEENGYDDEALKDELDPVKNAEDCPFTDPEWEPLFPWLQDGKGKSQQMFSTLIQCAQRNEGGARKTHDDYIRIYKNTDWNKRLSIKDQEIKQKCMLYEKQTPLIMPGVGQADQHYCKMLAIQKYLHFDYFQYMVGVFQRYCINEYLRDPNSHPDVGKWKDQCSHFKELKKENQEFVSEGVKAFGNRVLPRLMIKQNVFIQDWLERTQQYILGAAAFVKNMASIAEMKKTCPFQIDIVIAYPHARRENDDYSSDDDDDDNPEPEDEHKDPDANASEPLPAYTSFGGIEERLKHYKLDYAKAKVYAHNGMNAFRSAYEKFTAKKGDIDVLRFKRFVVCIDRGVRFQDPNCKDEVDQMDEMFMFKPLLPSADVHNIPRNAVPEWGFNASKTCIIPTIKGDINDSKESEHITAATTVNQNVCGQMLMLSFHALADDEIRCFIHINGQTTRFMSEDLVNLVPLFFDQTNAKKAAENEKGTNPKDWSQNKEWSDPEKKEMKEQIAVLKKNLVDTKYEAFHRLIAAE